jgi:D-sedoheptulose 7-phosphate isomerase
MFNQKFLKSVIDSIKLIDPSEIERMVDVLVNTRELGRLFIIGSGGGAGHASHAVCDFRKLCGIEAYAPYDNISELTARSNDEGYATSIEEWLKVSKLCSNDCLMVLSVGGGTVDVSRNISRALIYAKNIKSSIIGIVGDNGGITHELSQACIRIHTEHKFNMTPITEGLQAVIWHLLVSHPKLQIHKTKW